MMKRIKLFLICTVFAAGHASAQTTDNRVAAKTDWSVFVEDDPKECWAVTAPKSTQNTRDGQTVDVRRGDILLFIFYRPSADVKGQVAFTGGYPFAEGRAIKLQIDGSTYDLATQGEWAWPPTSEDDAKIVAAMKKGAKAVIVGQSGRGTTTKDEFSLLGFTAAMTEAQKRCGG